MHSSRSIFPTTNLASHTCLRPNLSKDNSPSSPALPVTLTICPSPQPGPGLMHSPTHTPIHNHTHTQTHEQIQKLLQKAQAPSWAWREGPPMVLTLPPQVNRSGSYRPKELMLLVPRFSSAGSSMSVIMKDLCKSSLPFMGNSRRRQLPSRFSRFKPCITSQGPAR